MMQIEKRLNRTSPLNTNTNDYFFFSPLRPMSICEADVKLCLSSLLAGKMILPAT